MTKLLLPGMLVLIISIGNAQTKKIQKQPVKMPPVPSTEPNIPPVLLNIAGEIVYKEEFDRVFRKNNFKDSATDEKAVREYLELYINYKLKVKEAENEKLDTSEAFISELAGYRKQLAQPYLTDREISDNLLKEAYDRLKKDIRSLFLPFPSTRMVLMLRHKYLPY